MAQGGMYGWQSIVFKFTVDVFSDVSRLELLLGFCNRLSIYKIQSLNCRLLQQKLKPTTILNKSQFISANPVVSRSSASITCADQAICDSASNYPSSKLGHSLHLLKVIIRCLYHQKKKEFTIIHSNIANSPHNLGIYFDRFKLGFFRMLDVGGMQTLTFGLDQEGPLAAKLEVLVVARKCYGHISHRFMFLLRHALCHLVAVDNTDDRSVDLDLEIAALT